MKNFPLNDKAIETLEMKIESILDSNDVDLPLEYMFNEGLEFLDEAKIQLEIAEKEYRTHYLVHDDLFDNRSPQMQKALNRMASIRSKMSRYEFKIQSKLDSKEEREFVKGFSDDLQMLVVITAMDKGIVSARQAESLLNAMVEKGASGILAQIQK